MKRKLVTGVVSVALIASMVFPVYAEDTESRSMEVRYKEPNAYAIKIPASVSLEQGKGTSTKITATKMNVEPNTVVGVRVIDGLDEKGEVTLRLEHGNPNDTVTSTISLGDGGERIDDNTKVARFTGQETEPEEGTGTLYFSGLPEDMKAGTWKGTLTFEIGLLN